ncbi:hypothetical protein P9112_000111 [Eukaryota sp. TZLM1-RC]
MKLKRICSIRITPHMTSSYFAVNVVPSGEFAQEVPEDVSLQLCSATIAYKNAEEARKPDSEPVLLQIEYEEKVFSLCVLRPGVTEQTGFDIVLPPGSDFTLRHINGSYDVTVHGCIHDVQEGDDSDMEDYLYEAGLLGDDVSDEESQQEDVIEELSDEEQVDNDVEEMSAGKKRKTSSSVPEKKLSKEESDKPQEAEPTKPKKDKKKKEKQATSTDEAPTTHNNNVFTHQGVKIEETEAGNGPKVRKGAKVSIKYTGRLVSNGKVFDKTKKKPFTFSVGQGQVIRGMELGLHNMKLGGKRTITIPASLGYGTSGAPPVIPPNADLEFSLELIKLQ